MLPWAFRQEFQRLLPISGIALALVFLPSFLSSAAQEKLTCREHENSKKGDARYVDKIITADPICDKHRQLVDHTQEEHKKFVKEAQAASQKYNELAKGNSKDSVTSLANVKSMLENTAREFREIAKQAKTASEKLGKERKPLLEANKALPPRQEELHKMSGEMKRQISLGRNEIIKLQNRSKNNEHSDQIRQIQERNLKLEHDLKPLEQVLTQNYYPRSKKEGEEVIRTSELLQEKLKAIHDNNLSKAEQIEAQASQIHPEALNSDQGNKLKAAVEKGEPLPLAELKEKPAEEKGFWQRQKEKFLGTEERPPLSSETIAKENTLREMINGDPEKPKEPAAEGKTPEDTSTVSTPKTYTKKGEGSVEEMAEVGADNYAGKAVTNAGGPLENNLATLKKANGEAKAAYEADLAKNGGPTGLAENLATETADELDKKNAAVAKAFQENEAKKKMTYSDSSGSGYTQWEYDDEANTNLINKQKERDEWVAGVCARDTARCKGMTENGVKPSTTVDDFRSDPQEGNKLRNIGKNNTIQDYSENGQGFNQQPTDHKEVIEQNAAVLKKQQQDRFEEMDDRVQKLQTATDGQRALDQYRERQAETARTHNLPYTGNETIEANRKSVGAMEPAIAGAVRASTTNLDEQNFTTEALAQKQAKTNFLQYSSVAGGPGGAFAAYGEMKDWESATNTFPKSMEAAKKYNDASDAFVSETAWGVGGAAVTMGTGSTIANGFKTVNAEMNAFSKTGRFVSGGVDNSGYTVANIATKEYSAAPTGYSYDNLTSTPQVNYTKPQAGSWADTGSYKTNTTVTSNEFTPSTSNVSNNFADDITTTPSPAAQVTHASPAPSAPDAVADAPVATTAAPKSAPATHSVSNVDNTPAPAPTRVAANDNPAPISRVSNDNISPAPTKASPASAPASKSANYNPDQGFSSSAGGYRATSVNNTPVKTIEPVRAPEPVRVEVSQPAPRRVATNDNSTPSYTPSRQVASESAPARQAASEPTPARGAGNDNYSAPREPETRAYAYNEPSPQPDPSRGFFRRQADRLATAGSAVKRAFSGDPAPSKWRVANEASPAPAKKSVPFLKESDEQVEARLRELAQGGEPRAADNLISEPANPRKLSDSQKEQHPSRNVRALREKIEEKHGVKFEPTPNDANFGAAYDRAGHKILASPEYFRAGNEIEGKGVILHETQHMNTRVNDVRERITELESPSGSLHGGDAAVGYNTKTVADEADARLKQIASYRLDRLRAEQALAKTTDTSLRDSLKAKIAEAEALEKRELNAARKMIDQEREANEATIKAIQDGKTLTYGREEGVLGRDSYEFRFKDADGKEQVHKGFLDQYAYDGEGVAATRQIEDIKTAVLQKYGYDSPAGKAVDELTADSKNLTINRDAIPERRWSPKSRETGLGDIRSRVMADYGQEEATLLRRQKQLDRMERHFDKHYGTDRDNVDFSWRPATPQRKVASGTADDVLSSAEKYQKLTTLAEKTDDLVPGKSIAYVTENEIGIYKNPGKSDEILARIKTDVDMRHLPVSEFKGEARHLMNAEADRVMSSAPAAREAVSGIRIDKEALQASTDKLRASARERASRIPEAHQLSPESTKWAKENGVELSYDANKGMHRVAPNQESELGRYAAHMEKRYNTPVYMKTNQHEQFAAFVSKDPKDPFVAISKNFLSADPEIQGHLRSVLAHETQHVATDRRSYFVVARASHSADEGADLGHGIKEYERHFGNDEVEAYYAGARQQDFDARKLEREGKHEAAAAQRFDAQVQYRQGMEFLEATKEPLQALQKDLRSGKFVNETVGEDGVITFSQVRKGTVTSDLKNPVSYNPATGEVTIRRGDLSTNLPLGKDLKPGEVQAQLAKRAAEMEKKTQQWEKLYAARLTEDSKARIAKGKEAAATAGSHNPDRVAGMVTRQPAASSTIRAEARASRETLNEALKRLDSDEGVLRIAEIKDNQIVVAGKNGQDPVRIATTKDLRHAPVSKLRGEVKSLIEEEARHLDLVAAGRAERRPVAEAGEEMIERANKSAGERQLASVPEGHASRNVDTLMDNMEDLHGVKQGVIADKDSASGRWSRLNNKISLKDKLRRAENVTAGKSTAAHEITHWATDAKGKLTQQTVLSSDSGRVYGKMDLGTYSNRARVDELDARVKQLAALRLDRQRLEQQLSNAGWWKRQRLNYEISTITKQEQKVLAKARTMMARERQLTEAALRQIDNPKVAMPFEKPKVVPAEDSFVYRFTDSSGMSHVHRDVIPPIRGEPTIEALEARMASIEASIAERFGANSEAVRKLEQFNEKGGSSLSISRSKLERKTREFSIATGIDDVELKGVVAAEGKVTRADAAKVLEERMAQLEARDAHLEKHYGADKGKYDFGTTKDNSRLPASRSKATDEDDLPFEDTTGKYLPERGGDRPWGPETKKEKLTPFAERMQDESAYKHVEGPARDPAAIPDNARKWSLLEKNHSQFDAINEADNIRAGELAKAANAGDSSVVKRASTMQAAVGKPLNDELVKDKYKVNQLLNLQKQLVWDKIAADPYLSAHLVGQYSDFNNVKAFWNTDSKLIDKKMNKIFEDYNKRYSEFMNKMAKAEGWDKATGIAAKRENWHHLGHGATPDQANIAARKSRELTDADGISHPRAYEDITRQVEKDLDEIEDLRQSVVDSFSGEKRILTGQKGQEVLSAKAIDTIRKAEQTDAGVKKALEAEFKGTKFPPSQIKDLRSYVAKADAFSPDLYVGKRVNIPLDARPHGAVSADFAGQNARNLEETMKAMSGNRAKSIDEQLQAVRAGEQIATDALDAKKAAFYKDIESVFGKEDPDFAKHIYFSGDDGIYLPNKALTVEKRAEIAAKISQNPNQVRLTVNDPRYADTGKVIPVSERSGNIVRAEKLEKDLRKEMLQHFPSEQVANSQIVVDMKAYQSGKKSAGLILGGKESPETYAKMKAWTEQFFKEKGLKLDYVEVPKGHLVKDAIDTSDDVSRIQKAERVTGRKLASEESDSVIKAHEVGAGQMGKNKNLPAQVDNYNYSQLREKAQILKKEGFSGGERRALMENRVVGEEARVNPSYQSASEATRTSGRQGGEGNVGITLEANTKNFDSKAGVDTTGAYLKKAEPGPDSIEGMRAQWLKSGDIDDLEKYRDSFAPLEARAEFNRLQELRDPKHMPARVDADYYQQQANYTKAQRSLLTHVENEEVFGGLEKVMVEDMKLEKKVKELEQAAKNKDVVREGSVRTPASRGMFQISDEGGRAGRPVSQELEKLQKLAPDRTSMTYTRAHQVRVENGKGYVKIGHLEKDNDVQFMRTLYTAIKKGDIAEIDAGGVAGPKVLTMLTNIKRVPPPGTNLLIKGKIDPRTVEEIFEIEQKLTKNPSIRNMTPEQVKKEGHYWTAEDVADYKAAKKELRIEEICAERGRSLKNCGEIDFEIRAGSEPRSSNAQGRAETPLSAQESRLKDSLGNKLGRSQDAKLAAELERLDDVLAREMAASIKSLPAEKQARLEKLLSEAKFGQPYSDGWKDGMQYLSRKAGGAVDFSPVENPYLLFQVLTKDHPASRLMARHEFSHLKRLDAGDVSPAQAIKHVDGVLDRRLGIYREELQGWGDQWEYTRKVYGKEDLPRLKAQYPGPKPESVRLLESKGIIEYEGDMLLFNTHRIEKTPGIGDALQDYFRGELNSDFVNYVEKAVTLPKSQFTKEFVGGENYRAMQARRSKAQAAIRESGKPDKVVPNYYLWGGAGAAGSAAAGYLYYQYFGSK